MKLQRSISFATPLAFAAVLLGCQTFQTESKPKLTDARLRQLERDLKRSQSSIEELRERNLVLERRLVVRQQVSNGSSPDESQSRVAQQVPVPFTPSAALDPLKSSTQASVPSSTRQSGAPSSVGHQSMSQPLPTQQVAQSQASAMARALPPRIASPNVEPKAESVVSTGEQRLYSKVLETYRAHQNEDLQKALQILLKTYPDSVYADNALYLAGLLAFESNDAVRAAHFMDRVIREYPKGNKMVSALFARAMIDKRLGKIGLAKQMLQSIQKSYPGSPEAHRSATEMKLIEMASSVKPSAGRVQ